VTGEVEDLLTTVEAARLLGVSTREVRRKAQDGTLPAAAEPNRAAKHGYLFRRKDVEAYLAGGDGTSAGRSIVRPTTVPPEVLQVFADHTTELAGFKGEQAALREATRDNTRTQAEGNAVTADLIATIRDQAAQIAALTEELREERAERKRPWWAKIFGGHRGDV